MPLNLVRILCPTVKLGLTQGEGELHLRTADNLPFGVVNVGDSAALYRMLTAARHPDLVIRREVGFARQLFVDVDRVDSTVNVVIGARRFIAGWNSWRVSTMGLMHVGVGEGPEIIQMFGRGVRLMGWNMSLKRHRQSGAKPPTDGDRLAELETLRIFGLRATYMQTFRDLLHQEGVSVERETIVLPVTWNFARKGLKIIRLKEGLRYDRSEERPNLPVPGASKSPVASLDLYSRLQTVESGAKPSGEGAEKAPVKLARQHVALFDRTRVYDALLARKRQMRWHNLALDRATVDHLLDRDDWYELFMPPERLAVSSYQDLRKLEEVAVNLIAEYAARFWASQRRRWEHENIEVTTLDEDDPNNIREYQLSVNTANKRLIDDVRALASNLQEGPAHDLKFGIVMADNHAYKPLLYATGKGEITVQPVPLDSNERKVVDGLVGLAQAGNPCLGGRELFLIRNPLCQHH